MKKLAKMAIAAAIASMGFAAQADLVIDDFTIGQTLLVDQTSDGIALSSTISGATSSILGGHRDLLVSKVGNPANDTGQFTPLGVKIGVDPSATGVLSFSSDTGQNGYAMVRWDGAHFDSFASIDASGLGGVNLNSYGSGFLLKVIGSDLGFPFRLTAYTDATNYTTMDLFATGPFPSADVIDFSSFLGGSHLTPEGFVVTSYGTGVNFDSIGALEATINTGGLIQDVDLRLDLVKAVPEPESLALVGLGLLGLAATRRRKTAV